MNTGPKRLLFGDASCPVTRRAVPALLNTFCHAVAATESRHLIRGATLMLIFSPITLAFSVASRPVRLLTVIVAWWLLQGPAELDNSPTWLLVGVAFIALYFRELRSAALELLLLLTIVITACGFLRWLCSGAVNGEPFRQMLLARNEWVPLITTLMVCVPQEYQTQYQAIVDVLISPDTTEQEAEAKIDELLARCD